MSSDDDIGAVKRALPEEPSRRSARNYMKLMFVLVVFEAALVAYFNFNNWAVLAAINALPAWFFLVQRSGTSLDLNKMMDSATRMVEAKFQGVAR